MRIDPYREISWVFEKIEKKGYKNPQERGGCGERLQNSLGKGRMWGEVTKIPRKGEDVGRDL